jgi:hypothetical protein
VARIIKRLSAAKRTALIAAARTFLTSGLDGGPAKFGHQGRRPHKVDCLGLLVLSLAMISKRMQDRDGYGRDPTSDLDAMRLAAVAHFGDPIFRKGQSLDLLRPGDVALMRWHQQPNHVAIVTDHPHGLGLIHSLSGKGVVAHILADPWPRRILEAYRP